MSQSKGNPNEYFSENSRFSAGVSKLAPKIFAPALSNSGLLSRKPCPSRVQPGVEAFGYHQSTTHEPRRSVSEMVLPRSSGNVKSGAASPAVSTIAAYDVIGRWS